MTVPPLKSLLELHEEYVERVNFAVAEGHDDRAWQLAQAFEDEVLGAVLQQRDLREA